MYLCTQKQQSRKKNKLLKKLRTMGKKFVIGDREKNEWIAVFDNVAKKMSFKNDLSLAKEYDAEEEALLDLQAMQETGFFSDLEVYLKEEDGKAYLMGERDNFHPMG